MSLKPHILHVVGHTEAHHAATADDIIEACKIARRSVENALAGQPDMRFDPQVQDRKNELVAEAQITLGAIRSLSDSAAEDPLSDPKTLSRSVTSGILDAPQLANNRFARGAIQTHIDKRGACVAVLARDGEMQDETRRLELLKFD
jgi:hypothetical protein